MTMTTEMGDSAPQALRQRVRNRYGPRVAATPRKTPQRTLVIDPGEWDDLAVAAKAAGSERAVVLRAFVKWYIRRPGAKLPQRPGE